MGSEVCRQLGKGGRGCRTSRRRFIVGGLGAAGALAFAGRIWWVNASAFDYPEVHYAMGEWVALDGAFTISSSESTQGYSLCVQGTQVMTRAEYVEQHALDPSQIEEGEYDNVRSVLCLELAIKNEGNESGSLWLSQMSLVPEGATNAMRYQAQLWCTSNDTLNESVSSISLLKDSEYTTYIPYILYGSTEEAFQQEIDARRFKFIVSNAPTRNIIDIEVA